jgi:hypothetical protein
MKEEKRDYCLRMLRKLREKLNILREDSGGSLPSPLQDSRDWIDGLVIKLHDEHKDYMLPLEIRVQCNDLWKEVKMRINY